MESLEVMNVQPDEESWNMFVVCMFDLQRADEVFSLIDKMQRRGLPLETFQYNVMIASATKASNLGIVCVRAGFPPPLWRRSLRRAARNCLRRCNRPVWSPATAPTCPLFRRAARRARSAGRA